MKTAAKSAKVKTAIRVRQKFDETFITHTTDIRITPEVDVGTIDGFLSFWTQGREIRIGPLTPEQAEKLAEDLGYDAVV
ncbi:MAG: hypothetical protein HYS12_01375 [Planctomycetes bacterium]|nr:hypothetical protein [Planctomycetota bacterium]